MSTFYDQMGREVRLSKIPRRIISIVPSQTELLCDLGLNDLIVGITKFCIHPDASYRSNTRVGGTKKLNHKLIKELEPDLIIGNKEENNKADIQELEKQFPVWMSDICNLQDVYDMIASIGQLMGVDSKSQTIIQQIKHNFDAIGPTQKRWTTLYFIWQKPYMVAANDTFINNIMNIAGFDNAVGHLKRYPTFSENELKQINPELVLLSSEPFPFGEKHLKNFRQIFKDIPVLVVDGELFSWYGTRLLKTSQYLQKLRSKLAALEGL